ncbi:MAG: hypothetical protein A3G34_07720 [Candidatus Lindowbacteria bacterium RIFCSPLOWO2_12_FULL_62_27]|nr:MAG: hypothetical protein A3G34_07720 [Candidatus Lindowbacteria bacterium RIFCSPLOWO2_12_FULL_62_27]OGH63820.1 MAG: hypothetical protein A3I06_04845 [Candidatus Lindowbacteria bacterium RIFCSPLOWO2_02_FULL_62_12]
MTNRTDPHAPETAMRRDRILFGDGRALEPDDESLDSISRRLAGQPPEGSDRPHADSPFIQKFLRRFAPELRSMAGAKLIEAEVVECVHGRPPLFDLSSGQGVLDPREHLPTDIQPGARVWVAVLEADTNRPATGDSRPVCSLHLAQGCRGLSVIESIWSGGLPLEGTPVERMEGEGWVVDVHGFKTALPEEESENPAAEPVRLNHPIRCLILHYNPANFCVILSRKKYLEKDRQIRRRLAMSRVRPGEILEGRVQSVGPAYAWIDIEGVSTELSGDDAGFASPKENLAALQVGQKLSVMVLESSGDRLAVGRKQLQPDPWVFIKKSIQPGSKVEVVVRSLQADHVKVDLKEGFVGEIPWREAGWQIEDPSELELYFRPRDTIEAVCLSIQRETSKILLSTKALQTDPLPDIQRKYPVGAHVEVRAVSCQDARAKVQTDDGYYGFILAEDLSWSGPVTPRQFFGVPPGAPARAVGAKRVKAEVLSVDPGARLIRFGVKQVKPDPFILLSREIEVGRIYEGRVVKVIAVGTLVEIRKGLVGLVRKPDHAETEPAPAEGQTIRVMVLNIQPDQHRIALSRKAAVEQQERLEMQPYLTAPQEDRKVRMKDMLQADILKKFFEKREQ